QLHPLAAFSHYHLFFLFNDTPTTEIYTLSLHDALPISRRRPRARANADGRDDRPERGAAKIRNTPARRARRNPRGRGVRAPRIPDRKSTRLNSSHVEISYAVFCLKKKKTILLVIPSDA